MNKKERRTVRDLNLDTVYVPKNHVKTSWGFLFVPPLEVIKEVDESFVEGDRYIHEQTEDQAKRRGARYYTSSNLTEVDVALPILSPTGVFYQGILRYVKGGASLGTIKRNERERLAKRKK